MTAEFVGAARRALATWLADQIPDAVVLDRWPQPGRALPPLAVSITVTGRPLATGHATRWHALQTIPGLAHQGIVTLSYGRIEIPLQIDCWATTPDASDRLASAVSDATNVHPIYSLPVPDALPEFRRFPGLALYVPELAGAVASFEFSSAAAPQESSDNAQQTDWRSLFVGHARLYAVSQESVAVLSEIVTTLTVGPEE